MKEQPVLGRRERKKAATRKSISDTATMLFVERGFDNVSIREIAEIADVSPTTVFAHFPQKEALVFDEEDEQREQIISAVRDRAAGVSISAALRELYLANIAEHLEHPPENVRQLMRLLEETPALREYGARLWTRHEHTLAEVIAEEYGRAEPSPEMRIYARFVLQIQTLALPGDDPVALVEAGFRMLEQGCGDFGA